MSYKIKYTGRFKKSYKKCVKRGYDISVFEKAVSILSETGTLPQEYRPHLLSGKFEGYWECHLQPDWLLIWQKIEDELLLILTDTGTHSDLF